jgi:hypothetical protein
VVQTDGAEVFDAVADAEDSSGSDGLGTGAATAPAPGLGASCIARMWWYASVAAIVLVLASLRSRVHDPGSDVGVNHQAFCYDSGLHEATHSQVASVTRGAA